jgi:hypothetical protein
MGVDPLGLLTVNTTQDVAESWNAGVNNLKTTTYTQTTSYDWNAENTALVGSISYQANPGFQGDPGPVSWTDQSHPYEVTFSFNNVDTSGVEDADPTGNRVGEWRQYVVRTTLNLLMTTKTWDTYNDPETNEVSYDPDVFETEANEMMDNDPHTESGDIYEL